MSERISLCIICNNSFCRKQKPALDVVRIILTSTRINGIFAFNMNTIMSFLKDIDMAALVMIVLFGIPFAAMIVYAIVLHRRGKKMGVIYFIFIKKITDFFKDFNR